MRSRWRRDPLRRVPPLPRGPALLDVDAMTGPRIATRRESLLVLLVALLVAVFGLMATADPAADSSPVVTPAIAPGASAVPAQIEETP